MSYQALRRLKVFRERYVCIAAYMLIGIMRGEEVLVVKG